MPAYIGKYLFCTHRHKSVFWDDRITNCHDPVLDGFSHQWGKNFCCCLSNFIISVCFEFEFHLNIFLIVVFIWVCWVHFEPSQESTVHYKKLLSKVTGGFWLYVDFFLKQTRLDCVCEEKHSLKVCFNDIKSCCSTSLWRWVTEDWSLLGGTEEREHRGQDVDVDPNTDLIIGNSSKVNKVNVV